MNEYLDFVKVFSIGCDARHDKGQTSRLIYAPTLVALSSTMSSSSSHPGSSFFPYKAHGSEVFSLFGLFRKKLSVTLAPMNTVKLLLCSLLNLKLVYYTVVSQRLYKSWPLNSKEAEEVDSTVSPRGIVLAQCF